MIKRLRRRFITIAMVSIGIVLFIIMATINVANYVSVNTSADERLDLISSFDGTMPKMTGEYGYKRDTDTNNANNTLPPDDAEMEEREDFRNNYKTLSAETPFDTRYFTVSISSDGSVTEAGLDYIAAVSEEEAESIATKLYESGKTSGFYSYYKYTCIETTDDNGNTCTLYIFLDCQNDLQTFRYFLVASILISLGGLFFVFLLVLFFSKIMLRPITESYAKQKRFITDASHEIKTPLTIIDANTEIIEMEHGEDEWTTSIRNQIKRLTELTNKLVFLSRMDEENHQITRLDFSLSDAVSETAEPFLTVAQSKGKQLELSVEKGISYTGDESQIRQVVSLLLDNAIKYSSESGSIRLTLKASGKGKVLEVWNDSDDIAQGNQDVLFERFYRNDASRNSKTGGHGVGLSVVQAIVLAHKGKITARSDDGKSIRFTIIL